MRSSRLLTSFSRLMHSPSQPEQTPAALVVIRNKMLGYLKEIAQCCIQFRNIVTILFFFCYGSANACIIVPLIDYHYSVGNFNTSPSAACWLV